MAEKENEVLQDTQEVIETEVQETPEAEGQTEQVVAPQEIESLRTELERKEGEIKRLQGILKSDERRGMPAQEIAGLKQIIGEMQETQAITLDYIEELRGESVEEVKPHKLSHRDELAQRRATLAKPEIVTDPDVSRFVAYMDFQGLDPDAPLIKEAVAEDRSPSEALKYLRGKVEAKQKEETQKQVKENAKVLLEQELKKQGLSSPSAGGPSAPSGNWRDLSADGKILHALTKGQK